VGKFVDLPLVEIHIGLLANQVGITAPNTLYLRQRVHDLLLAVDIGVEETKDELEVRLLSGDERYTIVSLPLGGVIYCR
jgi:hypothetical protein